MVNKVTNVKSWIQGKLCSRVTKKLQTHNSLKHVYLLIWPILQLTMRVYFDLHKSRSLTP